MSVPSIWMLRWTPLPRTTVRVAGYLRAAEVTDEDIDKLRTALLG